MPNSLASLDGEIMLASEAVIPVTDEGLIRGDGAFEVIRVYDGVPYASTLISPVWSGPGPTSGCRSISRRCAPIAPTAGAGGHR